MEYDGAVIDLDGTVYRGDELVPGADDAIRALRASGVRLLFFSNNPTKTREEYVERLARLEIETTPEEVLSAGTVTTRYLVDEHGDDPIFLVGSASLRRQFEVANLEVVADATEASVLVVSWTREFDYGDMLAGYRALNAGATFYGTDPDLLVPTADRMVPGSGSMINAVGGIDGTKPELILGKPSAIARRAALEALDVSPERCVVVGDRLDTDVALGHRMGATTVLVRSGISDGVESATEDSRPDHVIESLAHLESILSG